MYDLKTPLLKSENSKNYVVFVVSIEIMLQNVFCNKRNKFIIL